MYLIFLLIHNAGSSTVEIVIASAAIIAAFAATYAAIMNRKMVSTMIKQLDLESRPYITALEVNSEANLINGKRYLHMHVKIKNWGKIPAQNVSFRSEPIIIENGNTINASNDSLQESVIETHMMLASGQSIFSNPFIAGKLVDLITKGELQLNLEITINYSTFGTSEIHIFSCLYNFVYESNSWIITESSTT